MKQLYKTIIALCMAAIMACAIIPTAAAEEVPSDEDKIKISSLVEGDGSKAYELVWRYKEQNGHIYKRRWNKTLNIWYDPAWILVY